MRNPSTERRWLQTAGLPLPPPAQAFRDELDGLARIEITPHTNRVVMFDPEGTPIGVADIHPDALDRIRSKIAKADQPRHADPAKGDTVVRPITPGDPEAGLVHTGARILQDDRDPPPLDLPDFERRGILPEEAEIQAERAMARLKVLFALAVVWAMIIAASIYQFTD